MKQEIKDFRTKVKNYFFDYEFNCQLKLILLVSMMLFIVVDFFIKSMIIHSLKENEVVMFLPGLIDIQLVYNLGAAFSFGTNKPHLLIVLQVVMILIIMLIFIFSQKKISNIGTTLILAGALSNLCDRFANNIRPGAVVDYFAWKLFPPYSIFNIADMTVVIGTIIIIISIIKYSRELKND